MSRDAEDLGQTLAAADLTEPSQPELGGSSGGRSGEVLADRYQLLEMLGAGGMGSVYRARDLELDEIVAVKTLRGEYLESDAALARFRRELKLARRVTHRSVARAYDLGEHRGQRFLTMELIDGPSLAQVLAERGRIDPDEAARVGLAIAEGLAAAHAAGVVHRDLKPDNVLLEGERVVITDFGVARTLTRDDSRATLAGSLVGTPAYMAPEQVEGGAVDARADLYALGVLLFELISGRLPFTGGSIFAVAAARLLGPAPTLRSVAPDCPDAVAEVVDRALARAPEHRYASARELAGALAVARASAPSNTATPAPASTGGDEPRGARRGVERRIAIVPLRNAGADADAWIADGLADDLVDSLSLVSGVRVRARAPEPSRGEDLRAYGRRLDVELLVEGSVRRVGERVRASLRLVSTADGFQVWARRFDASMAELLRIGDEAAQAIAEALAGVEAHVRHRATPPPEAVEYYLRAKRTHSFAGDAIDLIDKALALAPDDPTMLATFARYASEWAFRGTDATLGERARVAAQRAIALAPDLPEAHLALARVHNANDDDGAAMSSAVEARRHGPGMAEPDDQLGRFLAECDLLVDARLRLERAIWFDPTPGQFAHVDLSRIAAFEGRWDDVEALLEGMRTPNPVLYTLGVMRMRIWGADLELPPPLTNVPRGLALSETILRLTNVHGRVTAEFEDSVAELCGSVPSHSRPQRLWRQVEAECRASVGDLDGAARALRHTVDVGLRDLAWMRRCPAIAPLRERPDFAELEATVATRLAPRIAIYRAAALPLPPPPR